ncbi:hypothetical protein B0H11DRAFT_2090130 [Mycena galericulata]|nr:hypothetical protein B0H11DRAFT_2090130 [Mycena galericulata]
MSWPTIPTTTQQSLRNSKLNDLLSLYDPNADIVESLGSLLSPAQIEHMAAALENEGENHFFYTTLLGGLRNGAVHDIMSMPHEGPEAAKILVRPIPTTSFAIRQYSLAIGSDPHFEQDRQAFLFDFYDVTKREQLTEVPKGYTFQAMSVTTGPVGDSVAEGEPEIVMETDTTMSLKMQPVELNAQWHTTMAIRGVQFEVSRGKERLLQFIAM